MKGQQKMYKDDHARDEEYIWLLGTKVALFIQQIGRSLNIGKIALGGCVCLCLLIFTQSPSLAVQAVFDMPGINLRHCWSLLQKEKLSGEC